MVDKLEACTWCGHEGVLHSSSDGEVEWVRCVHCGRESPLAYSAEEAIRRWNAGEVRGAKPTPANGEQVERVARALADRFIERGKARVSGSWYASYDDMPGSYRKDFLDDARAAIAAATPTEDARERVKVLDEAQAPRAGERWQHVKRGTFYDVIGRAELQTVTCDLPDGADLVVYRGDDGKLWAREAGEFADGRFVPADQAIRTALGNKETDRHG